MKKILLFAATAMLFAACTNEDVVDPQTAQEALEAGAVGFDVYVPGSTNAQTRAGRAGVMTTSVMKQTGFGVYAYQNEREAATFPNHAWNSYEWDKGPNYMWNQQVNWNSSGNGWYYDPLKYWPNETRNDSQESPDAAYMPDVTTPATGNIDYLSFFAYAPWVKTNAANSGVAEVTNSNLENSSFGIKAITRNDGCLRVSSSDVREASSPKILYKVATDPDYSVDLLWGVAPLGGISYVNVAGETVAIEEGKPLIGLTKPTVNTSIKFLFQHALARLGVKIVAAVDQVSAGGTFDYGNSKITVEKIEIQGQFGTEGILNLNNKNKNVAEWESITKATGVDGDHPVLTIEAGKGLAPHLIYNPALNPASGVKSQQTVTGVTTTLADAIKARSLYDVNYWTDCATAEVDPKYDATRPYFVAAADIKNLTTDPYLPNYANYGTFNTYPGAGYFHRYVTNNGVAYTDITDEINTTYPTATVFENVYVLGTKATNLHPVTAEEYAAGTHASKTAYRQVGKTYTETGTIPQVGDYVFLVEPSFHTVPQVTSKTYYKAKPNYFMVIPTNLDTENNPANELANNTIKVKITYYVSTTDDNLATKVVYTKNEVEKEVVLPDFKNGRAYDLKLILGLTSVKVEAEATDWVNTSAEVNLPQNTSE
jgi:hypothetical protein